jgi:hypothetical protein
MMKYRKYNNREDYEMDGHERWDRGDFMAMPLHFSQIPAFGKDWQQKAHTIFLLSDYE